VSEAEFETIRFGWAARPTSWLVNGVGQHPLARVFVAPRLRIHFDSIRKCRRCCPPRSSRPGVSGCDVTYRRSTMRATPALAGSLG
jgi:hypothetical protein